MSPYGVTGTQYVDCACSTAWCERFFPSQFKYEGNFSFFPSKFKWSNCYIFSQDTAAMLPWHGPLVRYVKLRVAHAPGMPGTFSPPPRVSDPDMHHSTLGSLTSGFLWSRLREKRSRHSWCMRNPQFYGKKRLVQPNQEMQQTKFPSKSNFEGRHLVKLSIVPLFVIVKQCLLDRLYSFCYGETCV